jgi:hypothetical protein
MSHQSSLEAFIVDIEDSTTLLKLYIDRLRRSPGNLSYHLSVCEHTDEILNAVRDLRRNLSSVSPSIGVGISGLEELADAANTLGLRMASLPIEDHGTILDTLAQATACFVDIMKSLSDPVKTLDLSVSRHVTLRLKALSDPSGMVMDPFRPTGEFARRITTELSFGGHEDPFDDLTMDADFFDDVIDSLEGAFDAAAESTPIFSGPGVAGGTISSLVLGTSSGEAPAFGIDSINDELRDLFAGIAAGYIQPVKEFITELRRGNYSREWLDVCQPAIAGIIRAADSMDFQPLSKRLASFEKLLAAGTREGENRKLARQWKLQVLVAYSELEEFLPATFLIPSTPVSSEGIIINSLLKQVKGVGQGTIKKLFAAGMTSLSNYQHATPGDLSAAAGIKKYLAERICEAFRLYSDENRTSVAPSLRADQLAEAVAELKQKQFLFKRATLDEWYRRSDSAEKRRCRKERQAAMWRINVLLAESGEIDFLNEIKNLIFDKRIERLQELVDSLTPGRA